MSPSIAFLSPLQAQQDVLPPEPQVKPAVVLLSELPSELKPDCLESGPPTELSPAYCYRFSSEQAIRGTCSGAASAVQEPARTQGGSFKKRVELLMSTESSRQLPRDVSERQVRGIKDTMPSRGLSQPATDPAAEPILLSPALLAAEQALAELKAACNMMQRASFFSGASRVERTPSDFSPSRSLSHFSFLTCA